MSSKYGFEWNYFPVRHIHEDIYAIGCKLLDNGGIIYITCNKEGDIESVRILEIEDGWVYYE